jgi:hypothetical protein
MIHRRREISAGGCCAAGMPSCGLTGCRLGVMIEPSVAFSEAL